MTLLRYFPVIAARTDYSSRFVPEGKTGHHGTDIFAAAGSPVVAVTDGKARKAEDRKGGHVVYLEGGPVDTYYAHLTFQSPTLSTSGTPVRAGEILGAVGTSGNATGTAPHLHFQLRLSDALVDPYPYLREVDPTRGGPRPTLENVPPWLRSILTAPGMPPYDVWLAGFLAAYTKHPDWVDDIPGGLARAAKGYGLAVLGAEAILMLGLLYFLSRDR